MNSLPISKEVVLLGGGHAHVIVIRKWAMNPIEGVRLTLVSEQGMTPYSGMLPGLVAGHYDYRQSHIDLPRLCQWANIRFIEERATGVSPDEQSVQLHSRPEMYYDFLSVDTGGAPALQHITGAAEYATPVKPVSTFYDRWNQIEDRLSKTNSAAPLRIGVVGAGAGGFEILLAMHHRISEFSHQKIIDATNGLATHQFHWIVRGDVLPGATERVRRFAIAECERKGIILENGINVARVESDGVVAVDGRKILLDEVLWCTEAKAADWPAQSGLGCTDAGFVRLNDHLQSVSHKNVFAAGDVAIQENHPRPRAGVFAVRQGPILFRNLQNAVLGRPLEIHRPQSQFLTLLSLGHKGAIASRGMFSTMGDWVWRWKDHIDQTFMDRFNDLPAMQDGPASLLKRLQIAFTPAPRVLPEGKDPMRCSGCGSKVPGDILQDVLNGAGTSVADDSEPNYADDVALIKTNGNTVAQSVDQLRAMIDDPWLFARITTLHALSDLYASNVAPHSAMVNVTLPFASEPVLRSDLAHIMSGVVFELNNAHCRLSGGHTTEGSELALGLVVNGVIGNRPLINKTGATENQALILTKPLGVGVLLAAHMRGNLRADDLETALATMLLSNRNAGEIAFSAGATAMTDVTGFGLIGHLSEILVQSKCQCELRIDTIPVMDVARTLAESGQRSSLFSANSRYARFCDEESASRLRDNCPLVFDPQTSGGLLFSLPQENAEKCIGELSASGYHCASVVGKIVRAEVNFDSSAETGRHIRAI